MSKIITIERINERIIIRSNPQIYNFKHLLELIDQIYI